MYSKYTRLTKTIYESIHSLQKMPDNQPTNVEKHSSARGRIRGACFPPEVELTLFTKYFENKFPTWNSSMPACKWSGIRCTDPTMPDAVTEIDWGFGDLQGIPQWGHVPLSVRFISVFANELEGEVPLSLLPRALDELDLASNRFSGTLDLENMPPEMREVNFGANRFEGTLDLSTLPANLSEFYAYKNFFVGSPNLTALPQSIKRLDLSDNLFSGSIDLSRLPHNFLVLHLQSNHLERATGLDLLPPTLEELNLENNVELCGEYDKTLLPVSLLFETLETNLISVKGGYTHYWQKSLPIVGDFQ